MFSSPTSAALDPDEERDPPPPPTVVYFPHNDIKFQPDQSWTQHLPDLFGQYSHISKPSDVRLSHLTPLNVSITNDVDLETLIPVDSDGTVHLPSNPSAQSNGSLSKSVDPKFKRTSTDEAFSPGKDPLLSNGTKAPEFDTFVKYIKELQCENEDALRVIWRKKQRPGHPAPNLSHFRKFWGHLESLFLYWDTTLDNYYELDEAAMAKNPPKSPNRFKRLSVALGHHRDSSAENLKPSSNRRYKGRRTSTGSKMPEIYRLETVRNFIEPLAWAFGCRLINPRKIPHMEIRSLLIPVTQTAQVWRTPQDKTALKRGFTEGPVLGVQCRAETVGFLKDSQSAVLDSAREIAGLMLLAQERAREGKPKEIPGQDKWYTRKPRWGGGPGGEFGDAEGNTDPVHHSPVHSYSPLGRRNSAPSTLGPRAPKSEEEIWKELKPGPGLWDPRHTYLAIGKERGEQFDNVFMISSLFHHVAILRLYVHPLYIDFLRTGKAPSSPPPDVEWWTPQIQRSRWYDLLVAEDRVEAMRGIWGVMSFLMRAGQSVGVTAGQRQKSEIHHHFPFRRKAHMETGGKSNQSMSVAF